MDLARFRRSARRHRAALQRFLRKLDEIVPENFTPVVDETDRAVWAEINCTACAHCCKTMTPTFTESDLLRIATHIGLTPEAFREKWLVQDADNGDWVNRKTPCQFLQPDNRCGIYAVRPADCREFPHHDKRPFDLWNDTFIGNVDKCPATFDLVSRLKKRVEAEYEFPKT